MTPRPHPPIWFYSASPTPNPHKRELGLQMALSISFLLEEALHGR